MDYERIAGTLAEEALTLLGDLQDEQIAAAAAAWGPNATELVRRGSRGLWEAVQAYYTARDGRPLAVDSEPYLPRVE